MDHQSFASRVVRVFNDLAELSKAVGDDPSLLGGLSVEDYTLFASLVKEYSWFREV